MYTELVSHIEQSLDEFIRAICAKYDLHEEEVRNIWYNRSDEKESAKPNKVEPKKVQSKLDMKPTSTKPSSTPPVEQPELDMQELFTANVDSLKAMCKARGLKVGGKKDELIGRLLGKTPDEVAEMPKPSASKKKEAPVSAPAVRIIESVLGKKPPIQFRRNTYGNYEDPETHLVFNQDKKVCGKQVGPKVVDLTHEDCEECKRRKWEFIAPSNLDEGVKIKAKVEELDDEEELIIESEEEDDEEESESEEDNE